MLFINFHRRIVTVIITAYKKQSELGKFRNLELLYEQQF